MTEALDYIAPSWTLKLKYQWFLWKSLSLCYFLFVCINYRRWFSSFNYGKTYEINFFRWGYQNLSSIYYTKNKTERKTRNVILFRSGLFPGWNKHKSKLFWKSNTRFSSPDIAAATKVIFLWISRRFSTLLLDPCVWE